LGEGINNINGELLIKNPSTSQTTHRESLKMNEVKFLALSIGLNQCIQESTR
jgi:hypothetical protein